MPLLFDSDYKILADCGLQYEEDEANRFLILKNFPLKDGLYSFNGVGLIDVDVLIVIPPNYNTAGNDMLWVSPELKRTDGKAIPAAFGVGKGAAKHYQGKEFCRWSRHFPPNSWRPKVDNIQKIIDRVQWALSNPDAVK
jgi:hypothetical protein